MRGDRRHRVAGRRAARSVTGLVCPYPGFTASCLLLVATLPATLQAGSPLGNSFGDLNAHLRSHGAAVSSANSSAQTGGHHDQNLHLNLARQLLNLRVTLQVPINPGSSFPDTSPTGGGSGSRSSGLGGDLTTDLFVQQQVAIENWAPGGPNFSFNDRGTLVSQGGDVVITPTSSHQIGNFNLQTAAINGQYNYVNDIDADHGWQVHAPFDITSSASGSADTTTETSEVRVDLQWVGTYSHPAEAYDPPTGGGHPAPIGALDFFTFDIEGNAAAQYFNPTGPGGSNQQPGLPDLPDLPPLPELDEQTLPNELTGLNPYGPSYSNSSNNEPYNPYNPQRYVDPNYNPYNPNTYTDPNYNPYNPPNQNSTNPYLASSPYNARGAPDNSALLAAYGGSASNVNNASQFDQTGLTAILQEQGVNSFLDYGSFSSPESAVFRGIQRPVQLTAVNQQELAIWIQENGRLPSVIATEVQVADNDVLGYNQSGNDTPAGYDTRPQTGGTSNTSQNMLVSYRNPSSSSTIGGDNTPDGYHTQPSFQGITGRSNQDVFSPYYNTSGQSGSGYLYGSDIRELGGDGIQGLDDYGRDQYFEDRARFNAEEQARLDEERRQISEIEQAERDAENMEQLTLAALELAKVETPISEPEREKRIGENPLEQERRFEESMTVDPEVKRRLDEQNRRKAIQDSPNESGPTGQGSGEQDVTPVEDTAERDRERQEFLDELAKLDEEADEVEGGLDEIEASLRFRLLEDRDINSLPPELQADFIEFKANEDIVPKGQRTPGMVETYLKENGFLFLPAENDFVYRGLNPFYEGNSYVSIADFFGGSSIPIPVFGKAFDTILTAVEDVAGEPLVDYRVVHHESGSVGSTIHFSTPQVDRFIKEQEKEAWGKVQQVYGTLQPGDSVIVVHDASKENTKSDFFEAAAGTDNVHIEWTITRAADGSYSFEKVGKVLRVDDFKDPLDLGQYGPLKDVGAGEHGLGANLGQRPFAIVLEQDL